MCFFAFVALCFFRWKRVKIKRLIDEQNETVLYEYGLRIFVLIIQADRITFREVF